MDKSQDYILAETEFTNAAVNFGLLENGLNPKLDVPCANGKETTAYFLERWNIDNKKASFLQTKMIRNPSNQKPKAKFAAFDGWYPHLDSKFKITFGLLLGTGLFQKTTKFLECYKTAKGVTEASNNII